MNCSRCQSESPGGAKFWIECGAPFARRCEGCASELPERAKFCPECGRAAAAAAAERSPRAYTPRHLVDRILKTRSALEGERKHVSVLFADVKGSMDLAGSVDPEEWHRILDRFFAILCDGVHRFEGTVNQFTGDGIMALFGAPIAHEDHAQRACHAALHLRRELAAFAAELRRERGLAFSVRIGINSGEVVVGRIGDDLRMDYTAQGHTVGLAARMEQLAEPGSAYLTAATADLVHGFFRLRDLGTCRVQGLRDPVRVHELAGEGSHRSRFDLARARGLSRFVGREGEIARLEAALERAVAGEGRIVGVVADAGVGKSRLCHELATRCRARGIEVNRGQGVPHSRSIPFLPVLELMRSSFGISERDPAQRAREKVAGRLLLLDESARRELPLLFDYLGVPDPERPPPRIDPEARERRFLDMIERMVRTRSPGVTSVFVLEDLHWIDAASAAALDRLATCVSGSPTLVLLNYRPEYRPPWRGAPFFEEIALEPLGSGAALELLGELLGDDPAIAKLALRIHERTRGNPFFLEETVRSLVESGQLAGPPGERRLVAPVERIRLPDTVHAVLAARIDRLAEADKELVQTAAVIGKEFSASILERARRSALRLGDPRREPEPPPPLVPRDAAELPRRRPQRGARARRRDPHRPRARRARGRLLGARELGVDRAPARRRRRCGRARTVRARARRANGEPAPPGLLVLGLRARRDDGRRGAAGARMVRAHGRARARQADRPLRGGDVPLGPRRRGAPRRRRGARAEDRRGGDPPLRRARDPLLRGAGPPRARPRSRPLRSARSGTRPPSSSALASSSPRSARGSTTRSSPRRRPRSPPPRAMRRVEGRRSPRRSASTAPSARTRTSSASPPRPRAPEPRPAREPLHPLRRADAGPQP